MTDTAASGRSEADVIVIGAGQCGLATARTLTERGVDTIVVDAEAEVGDVWRRRWNSLRLFTPAQHDGLPGMPFPAQRNSFPTGREFGDYVQRYAEHFALPVVHGVRVKHVAPSGDGFALETTAGPLRARCVVVATGSNAVPFIPELARDLDPGIRQLHSSSYREPEQIAPGDVLVVGAGTSGVQIALDLAPSHHVAIAGRPTVHIPDPVLRLAGEAYWGFIHRVLTRRTPIGRRVAGQYHGRGKPLIGVSMADVATAGITRLPRVSASRHGQPLFDGGDTAHFDTVVWATGFRPDFDWVADLPLTDSGWPLVDRGVVQQLPGLFFVGLPFQYGLTSELIGGAARDAVFITEKIVNHLTPMRMPQHPRFQRSA